MKIKIISILIVILFSYKIACAQYYISGQDPASIKWEQINTENFQVIYPDYYSEKAKEVANIIQYAYEYAAYSLNHKPKKISLILHTETSVSNGMVVWAPKRMEWYTTPPQENYAQDWFEQLAIHETRHFVQVDKLNQGLTKILSILLGEQGTAAVLGLYIPPWFLEGDAVCTETLLSKSGRCPACRTRLLLFPRPMFWN